MNSYCRFLQATREESHDDKIVFGHFGAGARVLSIGILLVDGSGLFEVILSERVDFLGRERVNELLVFLLELIVEANGRHAKELKRTESVIVAKLLAVELFHWLLNVVLVHECFECLFFFKKDFQKNSSQKKEKESVCEYHLIEGAVHVSVGRQKHNLFLVKGFQLFLVRFLVALICRRFYLRNLLLFFVQILFFQIINQLLSLRDWLSSCVCKKFSTR